MGENFLSIRNEIESFGYQIISEDLNRPWGGFLVIDEDQSQKFSNQFFDGLKIESLQITERLSPKILIINPNSKLSWQYHIRRAEIWSIYKGPVGIIRSKNDFQNNMEIIDSGNQIKIKQGERHRIVGLKNSAIIAEIWQHTDFKKPSDENDIIRLEDDFGR
ncbi:MAG: phosphoheptose isomerase [Flavobacteriaceae bacterium]|nr:phosphoheptose isomerase [Flavobacteriaceae bacterium]